MKNKINLLNTHLTTKNILAVVIPYYKIKYFEELLESLSRQTNPNFNVYIGNDSSPDDPSGIIEKYGDRLNITYKRFETNLGGISLTKQWERCLEMIGDEEWIWVLPDDDVPSENVVEEFYEALSLVKENNIKIFRSLIVRIDSSGKINEDFIPQNPVKENNLEFYTRLVKGQARASLGENIFHRKSLKESGGFVDFPKAWGSDHATILRVSARGNIYYLPNTTFYFRNSGINISSDHSDGAIKMQAVLMFGEWLKRNEYIFPEKPSETFYKLFYWQYEHTVIKVWNFNLSILLNLYRLRKTLFQRGNIRAILIVMLKKIVNIKELA